MSEKSMHVVGWIWLCAVIAFFIFTLLPPSVFEPINRWLMHGPGIRNTCKNKIYCLTKAIQVYESSKGHYPLAAETNEDGVPTKSWRVTVLPNIEEVDLHEAYRHDEPWDSEHNLTVAERMPGVFQCPCTRGSYKMIKGHRIPCANYVMITGGGAVGRLDEPLSADEVSEQDGTSNTLLLVEVTGDSAPAWTEPFDLPFEALAHGINNPDHAPCMGSPHPGTVIVSLCDGSVRQLSDDATPEQLQRMAGCDNGVATEAW